MAIAELNQIFQDHCKYQFSNGNELVIKEDENVGQGNVLKKVTIHHCSNELIAIKLDHYFPLTKYFRATTPNINKGCDSVLIVNDVDNQLILFCELKSFSRNKADVANKFICSSSFIKYVNMILVSVYNIDISTFNTAGITFKLKTQSRIQKSAVRPGNNIEFENTNYEFNGKSVQVLEVVKSSSSNFKIPFQSLIDNVRIQTLRNWP